VNTLSVRLFFFRFPLADKPIELTPGGAKVPTQTKLTQDKAEFDRRDDPAARQDDALWRLIAIAAGGVRCHPAPASRRHHAREGPRNLAEKVVKLNCSSDA